MYGITFHNRVQKYGVGSLASRGRLVLRPSSVCESHHQQTPSRVHVRMHIHTREFALLMEYFQFPGKVLQYPLARWQMAPTEPSNEATSNRMLHSRCANNTG